MASSNEFSNTPASAADDHDLAQTLQQIAKGEKTAQVLESSLTSLEKKIDDLLASFEDSERAKVDEANSKQTKDVGGNDGKQETA